MKEYKVLRPSLGWKNKTEKLEEFLNNYAKQGWTLRDINKNDGLIQVILERDKNR